MTIKLPEPDGKVYHEAREYEQGWVSSEDAYSESTVRALLAAAVVKERERYLDFQAVAINEAQKKIQRITELEAENAQLREQNTALDADYQAKCNELELVYEALTAAQAELAELRGKRVALSDEQIDECYEVARRAFRHHQSRIRGQQITPSDDPYWHFARAIERAHGIGEAL